MALSVSLDNGVICLGSSVGVSVDGAYGFTEAKAVPDAATVDLGGSTVDIPLTQYDDFWGGSATPVVAGTYNVVASDEESSDSATLTVVQLNDIHVSAEPAGSAWSMDYYPSSRNHAALKSATAGAVVTLKADIGFFRKVGV
jgi:hypothetical protein